MEKCPCDSGALYQSCCQPIIEKKKEASTPKALMRSRYTAYHQQNIAYIIDSTHPSKRKACNIEDIYRWAKETTWQKLEILQSLENKNHGRVEFIAHYSHNSKEQKHHEISTFRKEASKWYYYDGTTPSPSGVSRNSPCPCGSKKKYKRCCGK